jgi:hypothetical protein
MSPGCRFCAEAKRDLEERGVPYEEIGTKGNPRAVEDVMRLSNGSGIVPVRRCLCLDETLSRQCPGDRLPHCLDPDYSRFH